MPRLWLRTMVWASLYRTMIERISRAKHQHHVQRDIPTRRGTRIIKPTHGTSASHGAISKPKCQPRHGIDTRLATLLQSQRSQVSRDQ